MKTWSPQNFQSKAKEKSGQAVIGNAQKIAKQIQTINPKLPVIFTLKHLSVRARISYGFVRGVVSRNPSEPYRSFSIRKRISAPRGKTSKRKAMGVRREVGEHSFRRICVPTPKLMQLQRWIDKNILSVAPPHAASVAYSQGKKLIDAAQLHCGSTWLVKLDVKNFFESITEIDVYRVFLSLGYPALLSFELARICTRLGIDSKFARKDVFAVRRLARRKDHVAAYFGSRMGRLPQGAPTSPKLSNLVMRSFDEDMTNLAQKEGMTYTRYADDLCFSTRSRTYTRDKATKLIRSVYDALGATGLGPNRTKTVVVPPGARKVVLGLTVNDVRPRLPAELKSRMRVHLHYLKLFGPTEHAKRSGFSSTLGMYRHLAGICAFAQQIEPDVAKDWLTKLQGINWI